MNERYLFRGKRVDDGEWVRGVPLELDGELWLADAFVYENTMTGQAYDKPFYTKIDPETLGQCTGLRDKSGKLIFEGDICKCHLWSGLGKSAVVECKDACVNLRSLNRENTIMSDYLKCLVANNAAEVIGNIHDNPELLEANE